ncbi:MEMO1 family [Bombardia bombarda]|uniref:MEMO1 family n=1 Tax=Bombardia bombarda TaxID=252184 RepID=A0AA39U1E2_9PEZI|nr:MEMO1 family [Bombardia bombarda]
MRWLRSFKLTISRLFTSIAGKMRTRPASHAGYTGSWYHANPAALADQLDDFLKRVPDNLDGIGLPVPGARVIIAPHAGYDWSGPCAAWAYKAFDLSAAKRVFVLGPNHKIRRLESCLVSTFASYATPFGNLVVDHVTTNELKQTGSFADFPTWAEIAEHSLEMHMPYLWKRLEQTFGGSSDKFPPIIPILVGSLDLEDEQFYGRLLAPYLSDPENAFIVSSDFCHYGHPHCYQPQCDREKQFLHNPDGGKHGKGETLGIKLDTNITPETPPHEIIKWLDDQSIASISTGVHEKFYTNMMESKNTVCGRHPIGVVMAAMEEVAKNNTKHESEDGKGKFKLIRYDRSSLVQEVNNEDFSVSYVSAYAII